MSKSECFRCWLDSLESQDWVKMKYLFYVNIIKIVFKCIIFWGFKHFNYKNSSQMSKYWVTKLYNVFSVNLGLNCRISKDEPGTIKPLGSEKGQESGCRCKCWQLRCALRMSQNCFIERVIYMAWSFSLKARA